MTQTLIPYGDYNPIAEQIEPDGERRKVKDVNARLSQFVTWQAERDEPWHQPDIAAWRDHLLAERGLSPTSVKAYLSTVRSAYHTILRSNEVRQWLLANIPELDDGGNPLSPADRLAILNEVLVRLQNAIHPDTSHVRTITMQDRADSEHYRLTSAQASELVNQPDVSEIGGLRDAAAIALLLCTGIREDELCQIEVDDLRQRLGGTLALRVQRGKGSKQRLVPYGDMDWCLQLVDAWLRRAQINAGPVFRGLFKGGAVREGTLDPRSVQRILARYPILIDGERRTITPHDCRRTYAKLQYDNGMEQVAIQQNLGHADIRTTLSYIGELDADKRKARSVIGFDLSKLAD